MDTIGTLGFLNENRRYNEAVNWVNQCAGDQLSEV